MFLPLFNEAYGTSARNSKAIQLCRSLTPPVVYTIMTIGTSPPFHSPSQITHQHFLNTNPKYFSYHPNRMPTKVFETKIKAPVQKLWEFHSSASALRILTPAEQEIQLISKNLEVKEGALHHMKTKQFGIWIDWKARITQVNPPHGFTDTAEKSPFKSWIHHHDFIDDDGECILRDTVHYELKGGPLAKIVDELMVSEKLDSMFRYRHRVTKEHLETDKVNVNAELFDKQTTYKSDLADD